MLDLASSSAAPQDAQAFEFSEPLDVRLSAESRAIDVCVSGIDRELRVARAQAYERKVGALIGELARSGRHEILIYGTGEVADAVLRACDRSGIRVAGFIVPREGTPPFRGRPTMTAAEAARGCVHHIVIGSFGSAPAMLQGLESAYRAARTEYSAFVLPGPAPDTMAIETIAPRLLAYQGALAAGRLLSDAVWLERNADERMDALVPLFRLSRRAFHLARYHFAQRWTAGKSVLDCASGTGYGVRTLLEGGAREVMGVDYAHDAVAYARRYHSVPGAHWACMDGTSVADVGRTFDVVTSFETLEHVPDAGALLSAFASVLDDQGTLIVSTPDAWPLSASPFHVRSYTRTSFLDELSKHFQTVELHVQWPSDVQEPAGIIPLAEWGERVAPECCLIAVCQDARFQRR